MIRLTSNLALFRLGRLICTDFNGFYRHGMAWLRLGVHEVHSTLSTTCHIYVQYLTDFPERYS